MIGLHTVTVVAVPGDPVTDISCLVDTVAIEHGRDDTTSQPDASTATIDLSYSSDDTAYPTPLDIGATVTVTTTIAGTDYVRFYGTVTDIGAGWADAGPDTPNSVVGRIVAVSDLASLGRRTVGDVATYPQELDGPRVGRILTEAGMSPAPLDLDPGTVQILARDIDPDDALSLAQSVAADAGGLLYMSRTGQIRYADSEHRRGSTPAVVLDACDVEITPTWTRDTDGLVNGVVITYGAQPEGGSRPFVIATRPESQTRYGMYEKKADTDLAALADAQAMANLILTRNSRPVWVLTDLPLGMQGLTSAETAAVLSLEIGDLFGLTGMPVTGSLPASASLWVEGWTEKLGYGTHELGLHVSGYCRTVPAPRWNDIPTAWTWNTIDPLQTWDSITCLGPTPSEGRWDDVAASLRWDAVAPAVTWDTWAA